MRPLVLEGFLEQPESPEAKARRWLGYSWIKGAELVGNGSILYNVWWAQMQTAAAEFWGCKPDSGLAVDMVRPPYWGQMDKGIWKHKNESAPWPSKEEMPSKLVAIKRDKPPSYDTDYMNDKNVTFILANVEKARSGIERRAIIGDELRKHLPGYQKRILATQEANKT